MYWIIKAELIGRCAKNLKTIWKLNAKGAEKESWRETQNHTIATKAPRTPRKTKPSFLVIKPQKEILTFSPTPRLSVKNLFNAEAERQRVTLRKTKASSFGFKTWKILLFLTVVVLKNLEPWWPSLRFWLSLQLRGSPLKPFQRWGGETESNAEKNKSFFFLV